MSDEPLTTPLPDPEPVAQISPIPPTYPPPPMPGVTTPQVTVPTQPEPAREPAKPEAPEPATPEVAAPEAPKVAAPEAPKVAATEAPKPEAPKPEAPKPAVPTAVAPAARRMPAPLKSRGPLVWAGFAIVVVALIAAIGYVVYDKYWADPLERVVKGHCLADLPLVGADEELDVTPPRVVPCEDSAAVYVVEANIKDLSEQQALDPQVCAAYDDATVVYRSVPPGGNGYVLCLRPLNG